MNKNPACLHFYMCASHALTLLLNVETGGIILDGHGFLMLPLWEHTKDLGQQNLCSAKISIVSDAVLITVWTRNHLFDGRAKHK